MKKRILCLLLCFTVLLSASCVAFAEDISNDLANQVDILSRLHIISGYPDGTIRPEQTLTRAEFAKVGVAASSYRNAVPSGSMTSPFADVAYNHWAAPYVTVSVSNGLITGYPDATFRPDQNVTLEEVVTILLRILGYTDEDFGVSWPYGQMSLASELKLTAGITTSVGQAVTRGDAITLLYNLMNTKPKNGQADYLTSFNYSIVEDVTLIATQEQDTSVGPGKILTSAGTYDLTNAISQEDIYKTGDLLIDGSNNSIASFLPQQQTTETYTVYSIVGSDILVEQNGNKVKLDLEDETTVYYKAQKMTLKALLSSIETGSQLHIYKKNGAVQYAVFEKDGLKGPVTVTGDSWKSQLGVTNPESATIYRDSKTALSTDIAQYDVVYYSKTLNTLWAYSKKVTGIYEKALPNQDMPTSIVVSGTSYAVEETQLFNKISTSGNFQPGDTVTLLYGNRGQIVDIIPAEDIQSNLTGYLLETGRKNFEHNVTGTYKSYYVKIALADGTTLEVPTKSNFEGQLYNIVSLKINDGFATLRSISPSNQIYGDVNASVKTLGDSILSSDVKILDIGNQDKAKSPQFTPVFLKRIDGVTLQKGSVLHYTKNQNGEINTLFLSNITGDSYSYGIVLKAQAYSVNMMTSSAYTYDIDGVEHSYSSNSMIFSVQSGAPAQFSFQPNGMLERISSLTRIEEPVTSVSRLSLKTANQDYLLADNVAVYQKSNYTYLKISLDEIIGTKLGSVYAFYDSPARYGGRVRVIVLYD